MTEAAEVIAELLAGLDKATEGPWDCWDMDEFGWHVFADKFGTRDKGQDCRLSIAAVRRGRSHPDDPRPPNYFEQVANAEHIARCHPGNIRLLLDHIETLEARVATLSGADDGLSEWCGWDQSRMPWSESKHKDAVLEALFRSPWSVEDAAALLGFIDRTWTRRAAREATR